MSIFHLGESIKLVRYSADLEGRINESELQLAGTVVGTEYKFGIVLMRLIPPI
jgi:hypothetical protein